MKYVTVDYTGNASIYVVDEFETDGKFNMHGQDFIQVHGVTIPVMFCSENEDHVYDFANALKLMYKAINVEVVTNLF